MRVPIPRQQPVNVIIPLGSSALTAGVGGGHVGAMLGSGRAWLVALAMGLAAWGCEGTALCSRMVECGVAYGASLPVNDSPQTRCEVECMRSDTMTPERARCITGADTTNRQACQREIVGCLGVDAGAVPQTSN
jgi:hypothetical protein